MQTTDVIEKYDKAADSYAKSRIGSEDTAELTKLRAMLKMDDSVLDVGCSAGRDSRILKDMGFAVVGADLSSELLRIARTDNPDIQFVLADMRKLPFEDGAFKAVWASAILHHVSKTEMVVALNEFNRVLAPGGILYIHTKSGVGTLRSEEDYMLSEEREFELVTADELAMMLDASGFDKVTLHEKPSKSREGLQWLNAFYVKRNIEL